MKINTQRANCLKFFKSSIFSKNKKLSSVFYNNFLFLREHEYCKIINNIIITKKMILYSTKHKEIFLGGWAKANLDIDTYFARTIIQYLKQ